MITLTLKKVILFALIFLTVLALLSQAEEREILSVKELQEDFHILRTNLETVHPGLYTYTPKEKLDSMFEEIYRQLDRPMTTLELYRKLVLILPPLGNNHTDIDPPKSYDQSLLEGRLRFPFRFLLRKDTLFVLEDASNEQALKPGTVITKVNGKGALSLIAEMKRYLRTDGYNESTANWYLAIGFSKRYAYYFGTPDRYQVAYLDTQGIEQEVEIKAVPYADIKANQARFSLPDLFPKQENYVYKNLEGVAYLRVRSFQPEKALPFIRFLSKSFAQIKKDQPKALILDVRNNGGGFPEAANRLIRYLIHETIQPALVEYAKVKEIPDPTHYEKEMFFKHFKKQPLVWRNGRYEVKGAGKVKLRPRANAFQGNLYVLINASCFSATGEFLGQVKTHTNAIFVGVEAGSNSVTQVANDLLILTLPHSKLKVQLPVIKSIMRVNYENTGHGVEPDVEIHPTVEDLVKGRDVQLAWILEDIRRNK